GRPPRPVGARRPAADRPRRRRSRPSARAPPRRSTSPPPAAGARPALPPRPARARRFRRSPPRARVRRPPVTSRRPRLAAAHNDDGPRGAPAPARPVHTLPGGDLLSREPSLGVPSAQRGLTTLFGMGRGVSPSLEPPGTLEGAPSRLHSGDGVRIVKPSAY